eukprot:gene19702-23595_t
MSANFLPPNLLLMFQPRPQPPFLAPIEKPKLASYSGLAAFKSCFTDPTTEEKVDIPKFESRDQIKKQKRAIKEELNNEKNQRLIKLWDPHTNAKATGDPYKTLFVSRISYKTSEAKLKTEFSQYGPIKKIRLVTDPNTEKPRGYAFIEYEKERDMKTAYKQADGNKLDDRRVLVDIERGRVIKNWKPRKFGGGLGNTRAGGIEVNQTFSGHDICNLEEAIITMVAVTEVMAVAEADTITAVVIITEDHTTDHHIDHLVIEIEVVAAEIEEKVAAIEEITEIVMEAVAVVKETINKEMEVVIIEEEAIAIQETT